MKVNGASNDLINRLRHDPGFRSVDLSSVLDPQRYIGRAPQQVEEFIERVANPICKRLLSRFYFRRIESLGKLTESVRRKKI